MSSSVLRVKIFDAKGTHIVPVMKSSVTVGSASHCDVTLEHKSLSGEHLRAWFEGGRIWAQDLGSASGTFLNDTRLPPLKPMLIRDLDVLRLGECPATLGLEVNLVRAPIVQPTTIVDEPTQTDIKLIVPEDPSLEKRRSELATVSRELADVKLQLQMHRLDIASEEQLHKQMAFMQQELEQFQEQSKRSTDTLQKVEQEKFQHSKKLEHEIADLKIKHLRELKEQREQEKRKWEENLTESIGLVKGELQELNQQKLKQWVTRPLSQDMILEWEGDVDYILTRVVLKKGDAPPPAPVVPGGAKTSSRSRSKSASSKIRSGSRVITQAIPGYFMRWTAAQRLALTGLAVVLSMSGVAWMTAGRPTKLELGYKAPARDVAAAGETKPKEKKDVGVRQSRLFKKSYTDNVLYTQNYLDNELDSGFRKRWVGSLNRAAVDDWSLDRKTISDLSDQELSLIQDLKIMREGMGASPSAQDIERMRAREALFDRDLQRLLGGRMVRDKFSELKKNFYSKNQSAGKDAK